MEGLIRSEEEDVRCCPLLTSSALPPAPPRRRCGGGAPPIPWPPSPRLRGAGPLATLSYAATLGSAAAFGDEVLGELVRRGLPWARDVVAVNDRAEWIQGFLDLRLPQTHRVLDLAHATR